MVAMGAGLKSAGHAARCTQPRSIYLTQEQRTMLRSCVRIAAEDESVFAGWLPGDAEYSRLQRVLDELSFKLDDSNYR